MKIDDKDTKVLELLKENSKLGTNQMSKRLRMPITTVHNRIKKLEKEGVIQGYTLKIDYKKIGYPIKAFILVNVSYTLPDGEKIDQEELAKKIKKLEGVEEVNIMTGVTDILLSVRVKDIEQLNDFVIRKLRNIPGVDKTQTMIVLNNY
jgi:DNA-binding Lrp family transcriptional regulator